jgi:hypothetical protein
MTDDRLTTTDAIKSLERALAYFDFPPGQPQPGYHLAVDAQTLALALAEFDAARARVPALEAALRDCLRVLDGVMAGTASIDEDVPVSLMSEMCAHFNGYEGGPDITRTAARVRELLGGDACAR